MTQAYGVLTAHNPVRCSMLQKIVTVSTGNMYNLACSRWADFFPLRLLLLLFFVCCCCDYFFILLRISFCLKPIIKISLYIICPNRFCNESTPAFAIAFCYSLKNPKCNKYASELPWLYALKYIVRHFYVFVFYFSVLIQLRGNNGKKNTKTKQQEPKTIYRLIGI